MYKFEKSVQISQPQEKVFDFATDPSKSHLWQDGVEASKMITDGPLGVGSRYMAGRTFLGRKVESEIEILEWDSPHMLRGRTVGGPVPAEVTTLCEKNGDGTKLTLKVQVEFGGFFKLAEGMAGKQSEKQVESDLATMKKMLEAG